MRIREGARAVLFDPADRILLVRFTFPELSLWAMPGGGLDSDETHEQALARELVEEAGLAETELGPWVWTRTHVHPSLDGLWDGQRDRYFLVRTPAFEPAPRLSREELAAEYVTDMRWWTLGELLESDELFAPRRLPELVAALLRDGPPGEPIDTGV